MYRFDTRTFAVLVFSLFATVIGVGIVVPLLPVYAHDLGASGWHIGFILGAFSLSRSIFLPVFGRISDRHGRKMFIVTGLVVYALISFAYIFLTDITALVVIRFFHGVGSAMLMPVIQAYVADISPPGREGRIMGLYSMFVLFGLSLGPLIGGVLSDSFGLEWAFASMGALAFLGFLLCLTLLPPRSSERVARERPTPAPWRNILTDGTIVGLFVFRFSYVASIGIVWGFVPLYASLKLSLSSASIGLVITLGILISGALNPVMGVVADHANRTAMVVVGGVIAGVSILSFDWAGSHAQLLLSSAFFGLGGGICMPALLATAARKGSHNEAMGSVMSLLTVGHSLGMLAGSLLGGAMMDHLELHLVFPAGAILIALGIGVFLVGTLRDAAPAVAGGENPLTPVARRG